VGVGTGAGVGVGVGADEPPPQADNRVSTVVSAANFGDSFIGITGV
jgi:hypothetical protein